MKMKHKGMTIIHQHTVLVPSVVSFTLCSESAPKQRQTNNRSIVSFETKISNETIDLFETF